MQFGTLLRSILFFGLADSLRAIRYGFYRDHHNRQLDRTLNKRVDEPQLPGKLRWARSLPHGAEFEFEQANLELALLAPDVLRISWKPGDLPVPYAIVGNAWPGDNLEFAQDQDGVNLMGSQLAVHVSNAGQISIHDPSQHLLRREAPPFLTGEAWQQSIQLDEQASIFGLGERAHGLNLRGETYQLWNQDPGGSYGPGHDPLYMSIPVYLCMQSAGPYLLFYENSHRGEISIDSTIDIRFERGALRSYFIQGEPEHLLDRYTQLTGRPPMPPRWSLGYHQSRWGYRDLQEIQSITRQFIEHRLPISVIHLDIDYMDDYRVFTFDPDAFGDVKALSEELAHEGIKLVTIIDPGVKVDPNYAVYQEGLTSRVFCTMPNGKPMLSVVWPGWVHFPDFTDPAARSWWGAYYPILLDQGIAGIWHDMNEPTAFAPWGDTTFPLNTQHAFESQGGDHRGAHNLYAHLMNRAGFEALETCRPGRRPWLLTRAGYAGTQHYAWNWTGDVETSWGALRQTVATMLGISLSGFAYTGSDIGGFSGDPDPELYLRWFQLGAFSPFFRAHSAIGNPPREPWNFEAPILDATRTMLELRYRLLPYLYTLAWVAHIKGTPLMRPTFWHDPEDSTLWDIADQFLLGPDLLVAPVLDSGVTERSVRFPQGTWYGLMDETIVQGRGDEILSVPFTQIPVFVRGGSILPMHDGQDGLEWHVYLPSDAELSSQLYTDQGDGYGSARIHHLTGRFSGKLVSLERTDEGEFDWPYSRLKLVLHGGQIAEVQIDGHETAFEGQQIDTHLFNHARIQLS